MITFIDILLVAVYLLIMLVIGIVAKSKIKQSEDFYLAGRSLNYLVLMATVSASIIGGGAMIGRTGVTYSDGLVSVLLALPYLLGMYFFSMISSRINHIGAKEKISSIPELMEFRFGKEAKILSAVLIAFTMMATVGTQITATATILNATGGISYELGAWIAVTIFVGYTVFSGLFGVVYTDVVQFITLVLFLYILLPIKTLTEIGGLSKLIESVPKEMLDVQPSVEIIGWIFTSLVFTLAGAEMWQRAFAAKSPKDARKGMLLGTTVYAYTIGVTIIIGLGAFVLMPNMGSRDAALPMLIMTYLPSGIRGLTLAALLAVLMSSADTYLLVSVQTIVKDIIGEFRPQTSEQTELRLSRIFTVVLGFGALLVSLYIRGVYEALMFAWTFYASSLGIPALVALFWRKATKIGIVAGIIIGFTSSILWKLVGSPYGLSPSIPGSIFCGISIVIVSLLTYNEKTITPFPET